MAHFPQLTSKRVLFMTDFKNKRLIKLDLACVDSIKQGLSEFQDILHNKVTNAGEAYRHNDIEFVEASEPTPLRLDSSDIKDLTLYRDSFNLRYSTDGKFLLTRPNRDGLFSLPILFALTTQFPDLKDEWIKTGQAIVAYSRRYNDTSSLWVDDEHVFGVETLYMLAKTYRESSYLLGHYFIPYWDFEHASGFDRLLQDLFKSEGWSRALIKTFLWCDNPYIRIKMYLEEEGGRREERLVYKSLLTHFKDSAEDYAWFKEAMIERVKAVPVMIRTRYDRLEEQSPVLDIYQTLDGEFGMNDENGSQAEKTLKLELFGNPLDNEVKELTTVLLRTVEGPLVSYSEMDRIAREKSARK
ncbi:MAG: hypothetical protein P1V97_11300 [Planctomycetota bacterium]|nr:hypothetical protein [Planctomycetota bacterium]